MSPLDRRRFLSRSLAMLGAAGAGAGATELAGASASRPATPQSLSTQAYAIGKRELAQRVPFDGAHQSGILTPRQEQATFVALDCVAANA